MYSKNSQWQIACSVTLMSVKAQSGFIDTSPHPFSVQALEQKDTFTSKHEWDLSRGYDTVVKQINAVLLKQAAASPSYTPCLPF